MAVDYPDYLYNEELKCRLLQAEFDYEAHVATLYLYDGDCTDMRGAIHFAKRSDPKVWKIHTVSGRKQDTGYVLIEVGKWKAVSFKLIHLFKGVGNI
jgi:hypothetical protein